MERDPEVGAGFITSRSRGGSKERPTGPSSAPLIPTTLSSFYYMQFLTKLISTLDFLVDKNQENIIYFTILVIIIVDQSVSN